MKIGILTYHRSYNYGALLQAVALRSVLTEYGHDVFFVDYWPEYHRRMYSLFSFNTLRERGIKGTPGYIKKCIKNYSISKNVYKVFDGFIKEFISPYCRPMSDSYDMLVYGSDQIWRKQDHLDDFDQVYFGINRIKANKHISYAASMGALYKDENDIICLNKLISNLDVVSVREVELLEYLNSMGIEDVRHDLDPTLLLAKTDWVKTLNIHDTERDCKPYILFYDLLTEAISEAEVRKYAESKNLALKIVRPRRTNSSLKDVILDVSPRDLVRLISKADMVITSSFHGMVFSIIFEKPFYASFSKNPQRAESILRTVSLTKCLLKPGTFIPREDLHIDYSNVNWMLDELRSQSLLFLKSLDKI